MWYLCTWAIPFHLPTSPLSPDGVDALLSRRGESEHDAMRRLKNEFLSSFDGVRTCVVLASC